MMPLSIVLLTAAIFAQAFLEPAKLLQPPTDSWPTYNGDYSGRRYSTLARINQSNIDSLSLAWVYRPSGGGGRQGGGGIAVPVIKSTPLEINGVLYFHGARPCLGGGCANRPGDLALRLAIEGRHAHRQPRRRRLRETGSTSKRPIATSSR